MRSQAYHQEKENSIQATCRIHVHQLATIKTGMYPDDLSLKAHVYARTKSVNSALALLRRNLPNCTHDIKLQCYMS